MRAQGFWGDKHQGAFFDIRVFNPYAPTNCKSTTESAYRRHEREKRRCYERRILEVEHGAFTPLVFSAVGGMGTAATVMYKRLAFLLADKHAQSYPKTMSWIRCLCNFSQLRSVIMCIRGAHSTSNRACRTAVCHLLLETSYRRQLGYGNPFDRLRLLRPYGKHALEIYLCHHYLWSKFVSTPP